MKKLIVNNTILFACIMAYIFLFKFIFGNDNILVAVMSITGILMFMGKDLTGEPIKNTFGLVFFYLLIGIGTFFAASNMWLAIPINFIIVFFISYSFGHILKTPMYIPFTFLYLFLLAYPVPLSALPLRLISLVFGALSIMVPQFLINKNKIEKASEKIFIGLLEILNKKIEFINSNKSTEELDIKINSMIQNIKNIIHDKKEKNFYIVKEGRDSLDILVSIEKINLLISNINPKENILNDVSKFFSIFKEFLINKNPEELDKYILNLNNKYSNSVSNLEIQILSSIIFLKNSTNRVSIINKESNKTKITNNIQDDIYGLKNIKFNSIKLTYAFHVAIEVSIACFIMDYFNLHQGRWIMYTVLSLTNPIFEITKSKAKDRIIATTIGAIFIGVTFSIFKDNVIRSFIIIGAGYGNIYCKTYRQKIIFVTMSAIGAAVMVNATEALNSTSHIVSNPILLSLQRIIFILIGALIALLINKFIFKYDSEKANNNLNNISNELIKDLLNNLDKLFEKDKLDHYINNVYILISQINDTIKNNINISKKKDIYDNYKILNNHKLLFVSTIYELNKFVHTLSLTNESKDKLKILTSKLNNVNSILNEKDESFELSNFKDLNEKIIASSLIEIKNNYIILNNLIDINDNIEILSPA